MISIVRFLVVSSVKVFLFSYRTDRQFTRKSYDVAIAVVLWFLKHFQCPDILIVVIMNSKLVSTERVQIVHIFTRKRTVNIHYPLRNVTGHVIQTVIVWRVKFNLHGVVSLVI